MTDYDRTAGGTLIPGQSAIHSADYERRFVRKLLFSAADLRMFSTAQNREMIPHAWTFEQWAERALSETLRALRDKVER